MRKQPNFVMIVSDQQRADWLGCYGHEVIKTPHIDALAEQGLRFTDFHTASPVCMPNRASIMTGRYPSVHGLRYNGCALSTRANTFVELLRQSGYQTARIGKSHLQPFTPFSIDRNHQHFNESFTEAWKETLAPYVHESLVVTIAVAGIVSPSLTMAMIMSIWSPATVLNAVVTIGNG